MRTLWSDSPSATRPALVAAAIETAAGVGMFLIGVATLPGELGISPTTAIFGPVPFGSPLIAEIYLTAAFAGVQLLSAVALGQRTAWVRWPGAAGAFLLALICMFWVVFVVGQYVSLALGGTAVGDAQDLASATYWVPITVIVGALNGLALRRAFPGTTRGADRVPAARSH